MRTGEDIAVVRPLVTEKAATKAKRRSLLKVNAINSKRRELATEETHALLITMKKQQVTEEVVLEEAAAVKAIEAKGAALGGVARPGGLKKALKEGAEELLRQVNKMPRSADFTTKENAQKAKVVITGTPHCANTSKEETANMEANVSTGIPR